MQETATYRIRGDESQVSELLANRKFKQARRLATKLAAREDLEQQPRNKLILQKTISELALGKPEQAYADLHEIEGTLELLADHLSFWMAQALENMASAREPSPRTRTSSCAPNTGRCGIRSVSAWQPSTRNTNASSDR